MYFKEFESTAAGALLNIAQRNEALMKSAATRMQAVREKANEIRRERKANRVKSVD